MSLSTCHAKDSSLLKQLVILGLIICAIMLPQLAFAADGDASKYGADPVAGADMIAFAMWIFRIVAWGGVIIGMAWLIIMFFSGNRESWKTAVWIIIIGAFGSGFIEWVVKTGDLDKDIRGASTDNPPAYTRVLAHHDNISPLKLG